MRARDEHGSLVGWLCRWPGVFAPVVLLLAALAAWSTAARAQAKPPIKIGVLYPFTGPYAFLGERQLVGMRLAFEQRGNKVAGRDVQLITEDTQGRPETGVTKVRKLIEQDRVHLLAGIVSSAVAYAVREWVDRARVPLVITMANAGELTRNLRSPYIFRTYQPGGAPSSYMGKWLYEKLGKRKAIFTGSDYAYGREHAEMFRKGFESAGGRILMEVFAPLGTVDFAPYVTTIARAAGDADVVHAVYSGTDGVRFVKAYAEFGLRDKLTLSNWGATSEGKGSLDQMGMDALGAYHISTYFLGVDNATNRAFLNLVKQKTGYNDTMDQVGTLGGEVMIRALEKAQGNAEDTTVLLEALRAVQFESPAGPFRFDRQSQGGLVNLYVTRAVKGESRMRNELVDTIPDARDPWWIERPRQ